MKFLLLKFFSGLEGLVLKDKQSVYEPNARHWLKIKKDYLHGMADSADLLVLGAYFGTGNKGGLLSVFLMGCYDETSKKYKTVCKVVGLFD
jgi:DNA ligase-3